MSTNFAKLSLILRHLPRKIIAQRGNELLCQIKSCEEENDELEWVERDDVEVSNLVIPPTLKKKAGTPVISIEERASVFEEN